MTSAEEIMDTPTIRNGDETYRSANKEDPNGFSREDKRDHTPERDDDEFQDNATKSFEPSKKTAAQEVETLDTSLNRRVSLRPKPPKDKQKETFDTTPEISRKARNSIKPGLPKYSESQDFDDRVQRSQDYGGQNASNRWQDDPSRKKSTVNGFSPPRKTTEKGFSPLAEKPKPHLYTGDYEQTREEPITKSFFVHMNGDIFQSARKITFNSKKLRTWLIFLEELTKIMNPRKGAIRDVVTPNTGTPINSFEELKQMATYVAVTKHEKLVQIDYVQPRVTKQFPIMSMRRNFTNSGAMSEPTPEPEEFPPEPSQSGQRRRLQVSGRVKKELNNRGKTIFVYRNGDEFTRAIVILLSFFEQRRLDMIFKAIEERVVLPSNKPIQKIFDMDSNLIEDPSQIQEGKFYVAAGPENFLIRPYGKALPQLVTGKFQQKKIRYLSQAPTPPPVISPRSQQSDLEDSESDDYSDKKPEKPTPKQQKKRPTDQPQKDISPDRKNRGNRLSNEKMRLSEYRDSRSKSVDRNNRKENQNSQRSRSNSRNPRDKSKDRSNSRNLRGKSKDRSDKRSRSRPSRIPVEPDYYKNENWPYKKCEHQFDTESDDHRERRCRKRSRTKLRDRSISRTKDRDRSISRTKDRDRSRSRTKDRDRSQSKRPLRGRSTTRRSRHQRSSSDSSEQRNRSLSKTVAKSQSHGSQNNRIQARQKSKQRSHSLSNESFSNRKPRAKSRVRIISHGGSNLPKTKSTSKKRSEREEAKSQEKSGILKNKNEVPLRDKKDSPPASGRRSRRTFKDVPLPQSGRKVPPLEGLKSNSNSDRKRGKRPEMANAETCTDVELLQNLFLESPHLFSPSAEEQVVIPPFEDIHDIKHDIKGPKGELRSTPRDVKPKRPKYVSNPRLHSTPETYKSSLLTPIGKENVQTKPVTEVPIQKQEAKKLGNESSRRQIPNGDSREY